MNKRGSIFDGFVPQSISATSNGYSDAIKHAMQFGLAFIHSDLETHTCNSTINSSGTRAVSHLRKRMEHASSTCEDTSVDSQSSLK
jgi:hypothetical protein